MSTVAQQLCSLLYVNAKSKELAAVCVVCPSHKPPGKRYGNGQGARARATEEAAAALTRASVARVWIRRVAIMVRIVVVQRPARGQTRLTAAADRTRRGSSSPVTPLTEE